MKARFNEDILLWAIATLQPASVGDAIAFIREIFPDVTPLPSIKDMEPIISRWLEERCIVRVHGKSRLYSISHVGNDKLSIRLRRHRDKARIFLLKSAHDASFQVSGEAHQELAGDSPAVNSSGNTQEGTWPISSASDPRVPRVPVRTYWPRVVRQLDFKVGSVPRSPDTHLTYYSFPSVQSIHDASERCAPPNDLSISDLGIALGVSPRLLTSFIHKPSRHYRQFEIGKRGGGNRVISSPKLFLKVIQYWLHDYFLYRLQIHDSCHSYQKGKSILSNAEPHVGKHFVANIDIENFFGSITKDMVSQLLRNNRFGEHLSNSVARLVTFNDALPQGAPTSPTISNAFLYDFDETMAAWSIIEGLTYTRYADDMTISGNDREQILDAIRLAERLLNEIGLRLNSKKTRIASKGGQQKVTGVVVNEKPQPPRDLRRRIRAMFHQAKMSPDEFRQKLPMLRGYLSYLSSYPALRNSEELNSYINVLKKISQ